MLIPELNRHLYVCGVRDLPAILRRDPKFWNVISIFDPTDPPPTITGARSLLRLSFYDVEDDQWAVNAGARAAHPGDLAQVFEYVDSRPGEAILIHCRAGVSRSTAVALALLIRGHVLAGVVDPVNRAISRLLALRPQAVPNSLVLRHAIRQFANDQQAASYLSIIAGHPVVLQNRANNPERK